MLITSPQQMHEFWKSLAFHSKILLLYWDLGAGKTTLIKGFAEGIGIASEKVQSPTYTYLNIYDDKLLHIDMYRLDSLEEMIEKGILNQISEFEWIVIEWPKREDQLDLQDFLSIKIEKISADIRDLIIF